MGLEVGAFHNLKLHICRFLNRTSSLNRPKANLNLYLRAVYKLSACQLSLPKIHCPVLLLTLSHIGKILLKTLIEGTTIFTQNNAIKSERHQAKEQRMKERTFVLRDKDNTIRLGKRSLKTKTKYNSTSK